MKVLLPIHSKQTECCHMGSAIQDHVTTCKKNQLTEKFGFNKCNKILHLCLLTAFNLLKGRKKLYLFNIYLQQLFKITIHHLIDNTEKLICFYFFPL